jgi:hypothetical protein
MVQNQPATAIDRELLTDASRCPSCGARLAGPRCGACGVDLSGPAAGRLWDLSVRAARLLDQREQILVDLRQVALPTPGPTAGPATVPAPPQVVPAPALPTLPAPPAPPAPPRPTAPPTSARPAPAGGPNVHGLLVGLGALLLSVAAVGFLIFSWRVLPLGGRAAIIGGCTVAVLALATWLRPRLPETGEAVGALGAVLVVADAWAIRRTGLFGADQGPALGYAAAAAAVCAALLGAWAVVGRVRAGSVAASILAPVAVVLAGAQLATEAASAAPLAAGLVAAAALAAARRPLPADWRLERVVLRVAAAVALALAALVAVPSLGLGHATAAALLAAAALTAAAQAFADAPVAALDRAWSRTAGVLAAAAAVPAGRAVADAAGLDEPWLVALVPAGAALVLAAVGAWAAAAGRTAPRPADVTAGAAAVLALATLPAAFSAIAVVARAAALATRPWATDPAAAIGTAGGDLAPGLARDLGTTSGPAWAAAVLGLLACGVAAAVAAALVRPGTARTSDALRVTAAVAAALALLTAPLAPSLAVAASVVLLVAVAVALGVAGYRLRARASGSWLTGGAAATTLLAVAVAWATQPLSVPVTLLAAAAALLARRAVAGVEARAGLTALATGSAVVVAGAVAGLAGRPIADRLAVAGATGALLAAALVTLPALRRPAEGGKGGPAWTPAERLTAAGVAALATVPGLAASDGTAWRAEAVLGALLVLALATCAALRPDVRDVADLRRPAAFAVTPVAAALAAAVARDVDPAADLPLVAAATCAVVAVALAALVVTERVAAAGAGRLPAELGTSVVGVVALLAAAGQSESAPDRLWLPLLLLGVAAAAVAGTPDRHRVGWLAGALLTASHWARLAAADVGVVEAYTVPPALALLAVAGLRLRRDPQADAARALAPGLALGILPSLVASLDGPPLRPAALLVVAALLGALAELGSSDEARPAGRRLAEPLLVATAVTAAGVAAARGVLRFLHDDWPAAALPWTAVEPWSLGGAAVVLGAAVVARGSRLAEPLLVAAALVGTVPSAVAAALPELWWGVAPGPADPWRAAAVLAAGAAIAVAAAWSRPRRDALLVAGLAVAAAGTYAGLLVTDVAPEAWTLPLAAALLAVGGIHLARTESRSWPALGPGLAVALLPSLVLSLDEAGTTPRAAGLVVLAGAAVLVGARLRLQAPAIGGAVVLAGHAVVHLAPYLAALYAEAGLWVTLGLVGAVLLAVGAQYERRLAQVRTVGLRLAALR